MGTYSASSHWLWVQVVELVGSLELMERWLELKDLVEWLDLRWMLAKGLEE